jgi:hydrogenase 3 maturation protease
LRELLASYNPAAKVALVGVGHPMRGDDYVGSYITKTLIDKIHAREVILFDVEDRIEFMVSKIAALNPKHVIIIDACEMNLSPGAISLIPLGETQYPFFTTHGIPLKLLATKLLPNAETWLLAIQPERMEFVGLNERLSQAVLAAANSIAGLVEDTLKERESNA